MRSSFVRSLGFALPAVALVTALHVQVDRSWGEWLDGIASGAWFALVYAVVWAALSWVARRRGVHASAEPVREFVLGVALGAATWLLVWALWQVPAMQPLRPSAFVVNSLAMAVAAVAAATWPRPRWAAAAL